MNQHLALIAMLLAPTLASAEGAEMALMKKSNVIMETQADTCVLMGRTAYVKMRVGRSAADDERDIQTCITEGKEAAKTGHAEIKAAFKKKPLPTELTEWRLEWMAAFDATVLKTGETESQYLRRNQEARSKVERATNKFEIAVE